MGGGVDTCASIFLLSSEVTSQVCPQSPGLVSPFNHAGGGNSVLHAPSPPFAGPGSGFAAASPPGPDVAGLGRGFRGSHSRAFRPPLAPFQFDLKFARKAKDLYGEVTWMRGKKES